MADTPLENEVRVRSPDGSVVCRPAGVRYQAVPISARDSAMEGAIVLVVSNGTRRCLVDDEAGPSSRSLVPSGVLADLNPNCVQLLEM